MLYFRKYREIEIEVTFEVTCKSKWIEEDWRFHWKLFSNRQSSAESMFGRRGFIYWIQDWRSSGGQRTIIQHRNFPPSIRRDLQVTSRDFKVMNKMGSTHFGLQRQSAQDFFTPHQHSWLSACTKATNDFVLPPRCALWHSSQLMVDEGLSPFICIWYHPNVENIPALCTQVASRRSWLRSRQLDLVPAQHLSWMASTEMPHIGCPGFHLTTKILFD